MEVEFEAPSKFLLEQLRAAQREWLAIPCYNLYVYGMTGGGMGSPTDCGYCHICIRREAIRQALEPKTEGK